jgi:predicted negative regulator of RcsB-dependent stress response
MALTFKFDEQQLERLVTAINNLSDNVAKWQGNQADATRQGFNDLISALGGVSDEQLQTIIDQIAAGLNLTADEVQAALNQFNQPKENDNGS